MKWILPILLFTLILVGCESSGELRVINSSQNIVYFTIEGSSYELSSGTSQTVDLDVDEDWEIFETDSKDYVLFIEGETFMIWDINTQDYTTYTKIDIQNGKTLNVYTAPTHACVKVVNGSTQNVAQVLYDRYEDGLLKENDIAICDDGIEPGSSWFYRLTPTSDMYERSYSFTVVLQDGSTLLYPETVMELDELYLIELGDSLRTSSR